MKTKDYMKVNQQKKVQGMNLQSFGWLQSWIKPVSRCLSLFDLFDPIELFDLLITF